MTLQKKWYKANLGIDMIPIKMKKKNPPQKIIHPIPSHNGFGSEEDSLLSVYFLRPEQKIRDMIKMFKSDKHILRFNAKLISSVPSDGERKFIASIFARDDTVHIFELADKNSGRISCKFMERQKVKNPYTNKYYSEKDFAVGHTIYCNKYIFKLFECDEYTKKYMKDNPEAFRDSDVVAIIERIKIAGMKHQSAEDYAVEVLKTIDPLGAHFVSKEDVLDGFKKLNLHLSTQEMITLADSLNVNENGLLSMEDLFNYIISY